MARVLLLATTTGYQTRAFGEAADALGVELVFATDRCQQIDDPWRDGAIAIRFHEEARSVDAIVAASRQDRIDGILAVGDRPTVIAARAAEALGLPWHPPDAAIAARHKVRTRERLRAAGLRTPSYVESSIADDPAALLPLFSPLSPQTSALPFPCVVKPVSLSGSRGVMRADDRESFLAAFHRLRALLKSPDVQGERNVAHDTIVIEEFIPGREYAIEGLMHHGTLQVLAIFDKPDPLDGPFFEETIYITPPPISADAQRSIRETVARAAAAIGLHHGPIHAECRVNDSGVYVLEVAARPIGGICARALRFRPHSIPSPQPPAPSPLEISLEELLLRHTLGENPAAWTRVTDASGVMMIPIPRRGIFRGVDGIDAAKHVPCVTDVRITAKPDQKLIPLPEGASYLGFIFARSTAATDVDSALRAAHARLAFQVESELPVLTAPQIR